MSARNSGVKPIEARKRLLVAESDLNRAELREEWCQLCSSFSALGQHVASFGSVASKASLFLAGFATLRRLFSHNGKTSWLSMLFKGARIGTSIWMAMRSRKQA